jgi:hypothetical protein
MLLPITSSIMDVLKYPVLFGTGLGTSTRSTSIGRILIARVFDVRLVYNASPVRQGVAESTPPPGELKKYVIALGGAVCQSTECS